MLDMNNVEIKTGDVVEISGAYFKNDNGLYFVERSAGDPGWSGSDHSLRKMSKTGKLSTAKHNICFWPIMITTNSWIKRAEAKQWNAEHARIQVRNDIDRSKVAEHFMKEAEGMIPEIERLSWNFGDDCQCTKDQKERKAFFGKHCKRNHVSIETDGGRMAAFHIHFKMYFDNNFYNFLNKILYFLLTKYILKCIIYLEVKERTEYKNEKI